MRKNWLCVTGIPSRFLLWLLLTAISAFAQTTAFTYQGKLVDNGNLANGNYDLQFALFDAVSGGTQQGTTQTLSNVSVTNGIFTVTLDFGVCASCFNGAARFLAIAVKPTGGGSFTTLSPRQPITSTPYALKTTNLTFNGPFNASGIIFTASNTFAGDSAGVNTTPSGTLNNVIGKFNSFYGAGAGLQNTLGFQNAFFGTQAGNSNITGGLNAFFGYFAGFSNTAGSNAFFGSQAGKFNTTGSQNAFFGDNAGLTNATGGNNTFIGYQADFNGSNLTSDNNTLLGAFSKVTSGVSNATAIGANASVTQSNSLVLGGISGVSGTDTNVGIGTTAPSTRLEVVAPATQLRFGPTTADNGGYLVSTSPSQAIIVGGAKFDGSNWIARDTAASIMAQANGVIQFTANSNLTVGSPFSPTERMRIGTDGRVGIGTLSPDQTLTVNGGASKPGGGSWATFSDARLKNITGRFTPGLRAVLQLQPIRYEYKRDNALGIHSEGEHIGFSAQQVAKVIPEAVQKNAQGYLLINNDPIMWAAVNAIKEQQAQIEKQQTQINQQQGEIAALQQQLRQVNQQRAVIRQQQQEMAAIKRLLCASRPRAAICKAKALK